MRLFPILILIMVAVVAIKVFSIAFDQNTVVVGVSEVAAAEGDASEASLDETSEEAQKLAAEEADKNLKIRNEELKQEGKINKENIDLLLQEKENQGTKQFFTDTELQLLQSLKQRRDMLDKRERQIDIQAKLLEAAEAQLDQKIAQLTKLEATIKQKLGEANDEEAGRFSSLVKTYEAMKPKDAAKILSILDLSIMEKISRSMSTKKLAPILAKMDMKAARALTIRLAQPPKELKMDDIMPPATTQANSKLPTMNLE